MRQALEEVRYLVNRGYPRDSAVRFVSDHHRLPDKERFVLMRVVVSSSVSLSRRSKKQRVEDLRGKKVLVDGYNVLITTESLLAGYPVYLCDDGFLRDTRGIFRSYKASRLTARALGEILDLLAGAGPACLEVLLDQQMSRSGEMAEAIRCMIEERGLPGTARTARDVDHLLKAAEAVVATSDGNVIDSIDLVYDLPAGIARRQGISPILVQ